MKFYNITDRDLPKPIRANFILSVETDELFITAGLQDRVVQVGGASLQSDIFSGDQSGFRSQAEQIAASRFQCRPVPEGQSSESHLPSQRVQSLTAADQPGTALRCEPQQKVYEGLVYMDFSKELMDENGYAYLNDPSDSGRIHSNVRQRWLNGDLDVIEAMKNFADLTDQARPVEGSSEQQQWHHSDFKRQGAMDEGQWNAVQRLERTNKLDAPCNTIKDSC
ncbi:hypothetical protein JZ751_021121 [Albula glossodonta]|uniref:Uncharacterized protein n=1 Tax=Albula glossodonta TaxID=121402 RepID=A0A8T2PNY9_9TELE|nr:hypothetical protein JZ751_021121 [Albula glossodonta]